MQHRLEDASILPKDVSGPFGRVRELARSWQALLTDVDPRATEFLLESNAIEGITNIDYRDPAYRQPGRGHWGALLLMLEHASQFPPFDLHAAPAWYAAVRSAEYRPLTIEDICAWQGLIAAEQIEAGHKLAPQAIGRIRSEALPVDVVVGRHIPPSFAEVPERLHRWLTSLNDTLTLNRPVIASDTMIPECLGTYFQWFEAIHPFVDGNGRVGRLIANYIVTYFQLPIIVFRASERAAYYAAHRSKAAMRIFMSDKYRERIRGMRGEILERQKNLGAADLYRDLMGEGGCMVERHELLRAREEWARQADRKE